MHGEGVGGRGLASVIDCAHAYAISCQRSGIDERFATSKKKNKKKKRTRFRNLDISHRISGDFTQDFEISRRISRFHVDFSE